MSCFLKFCELWFLYKKNETLFIGILTLRLLTRGCLAWGCCRMRTNAPALTRAATKESCRQQSRWSATRRSCSWTSRQAAWTRPRAAFCGSASCGPSERAAPSCSLRTAWRSARRCAPDSQSWSTAGSPASAAHNTSRASEFGQKLTRKFNGKIKTKLIILGLEIATPWWCGVLKMHCLQWRRTWSSSCQRLCSLKATIQDLCSSFRPVPTNCRLLSAPSRWPEPKISYTTTPFLKQHWRRLVFWA